MIGETLNHYKILSKLGSGGMGEVYVAEDSKLGRKVALKVLPAEMAADPERRTRFEREARAVAALNHPNIVTVYSVEQADTSTGAVHFITMELVKGKTLTELIPASGMPLSTLVDHVIVLADAVTAAHRKGITHRDLKPDNVMMAEEGRLKVLDFGLAKVGDTLRLEEHKTSLPTRTVTQEGKILGTVAYMAPEAAEGKPADARSDVFSLGVILYQMATGRQPFKGDTTISTITSIMRDAPQSITEINNSLPRHLSRIVNRCLHKDPERRYQTAHELRNDMQALKEEIATGELDVSTVAAASVSGRSRPTWLVGVLALVAIAAVTMAVVLLMSRRPAQQGLAATAPLQNMEIVRLTATGQAREAAISPDGRYVADIVDKDGDASMWVTQVSTGSKVLIVPPTDAGLWDPIFSPDGEFIYFIRNEEGATRPDLFRVPTLGGMARKVLGHVSGRVSFSADGQQVVFLRNDPEKSSLVVSDLDGSSERVLAERRPPEEFDDPVWSPDGKVIAAPLQTFSGGIKATVGAFPAEGGDWSPITDRTWFDVSEMAWLPDGSGLVVNADAAFNNMQLWEIGYPGGQARRVTNDLNSYHGVGLSADGSMLVTQLNETTRNLWTLALNESRQPERITSGTNTAHGQGIDWLPDGRIVYGSNSGGKLDVWIVQADGSGATQLTSGTAHNAFPQVTGDGRYIVFLSTRSGTVNVWRMDADGRSPVRLTDGDLDVQPEPTPDGGWVVYLQVGSGKLYKIPIDGGESVEISARRSGGGRVSPDGKRIVAPFWYPDLRRWRVDVVPLDGGDPIASFEEENAGNWDWSPDGKALTYVKSDGGVSNLWRRPLDGSDPVQLTHFDEDFVNDYAWHPDGKRLVVARGRTTQDIVLIKSFR